MWEQARAADPDGNPLSPLDTLILHELTEMAAIRTGLPPEAAHVVANVMERMCARAVELADAAAYFFGEQRDAVGLEPTETPARRASDAEKAQPVLVVDDSSMSRHVVATLLRRLGQPVIEAADGEQAQALSREHGPRLLVLDIGLPDIDGLALLESLRERPGQAETPAIIVTGDRTPDSILKARKLGVSDYLTKPVDRKDLTQRIKRLLDDG